MPRCPNCAAELTHEYCGECGQRRIHPQDLSARHFMRELVDEIVPYLIVALKRVYLEGNGAILLKAGALFILTLAINNFASSTAIRLTLMLV